MNRKLSKKRKNLVSKRRSAEKRLKKMEKSKRKKSYLSSKSVKGSYDVNMTSNWYWANYKMAQNYWRNTPPTDNWRALFEDHPGVEDLIKEYLPHTYSLVSGINCYDLGIHKWQKHFNSNFQPKTKSLNSKSSVISTACESDQSTSNSGDSEELEFEMSEEMIEFFKVSFKHKMKLQKEKEEKEKKIDIENEVLEMQSNRLKRSNVMKLLYGEESSKIIGMETALQLSFDKYCDTKSPKYWPNIPLRL